MIYWEVPADQEVCFGKQELEELLIRYVNRREKRNIYNMQLIHYPVAGYKDVCKCKLMYVLSGTPECNVFHLQ